MEISGCDGIGGTSGKASTNEKQEVQEECVMTGITEKIGNLCIWCTVAGIAALAVITAGVLIWVGTL